jgi:uncharacterized repeat protein (TIGR01451 family)
MKKLKKLRLSDSGNSIIKNDYVNHREKIVNNKNIPFFILKKGIFSFFMVLLIGFMVPIQSFGQASPNEALWSENGWSLKKVVSNTTIASGVNFSYTIIFSAPAGSSSISIRDVVPATLQIVSVTSAGPVCAVAPTTSVSGDTVKYNLSGLPGACAPMGSFTIVVKFPEGTTCNGATARNKAEILVNDKWQSTPYVSASATAVIPWKVSKTIIAKAVVNPNGGNCGYIMAPDDTITYRLSVLKNNPYYGNVVGQQNMGTAVVKDNLPTGAVFVSSTNPTCVSSSGGIITWNVNCPTQLLDAANPWAYYWVDIKVKYPVGSFPINTQILNQAILTGMSCNQQFSDTSNQTCITVAAPNPSGTFGKYISLANRVPGCTGIYTIAFCNNGNVPLTAFNIDDVIPSGVTVNQVAIYGANATTTIDLNINNSPYATGLNAYYSSPVITSPVSNIQVQMMNTLPVGACIYMYVYFTVNSNPTGTVVTNCATFNGLSNSLTLPQACISFTVDAGAPKPCIVKGICSPQSSYVPGDTIRFRLRVQNIGSATLTGANLQDVLHSNFSYVGNESYFVSNTYNPACSVGSSPPSGTTAWSGVTSAHSGNNLQWNLPSIASDCQLFYSSYCGYYGTYGIPYYYIEFDVKVDSIALPGVTPNFFQISGGNLTAATTSNTVNVLITASFGQEVTKLLTTDNGATFASNGTIAPGATAKYRLNYKNTSNVPLSSITLIDLLAMDAGASDFLIFNRSINRGSQFSVSYIGNHATSLSPVSPAPTPAIQWAPGTNICLPPYVTTGGCSATSWGGIPTSNVRMSYGTFSLVPGKNLREDFEVGIPLTATSNQQVCNDFAAIASASFLLNGSPQSVNLTPVAAPPVCLTVDSISNCCDNVIIERISGADGVVGCCARIATECDVDSVTVNIINGTIGSVNWSCGPLPSGYVGLTDFTFISNGCALDMITCINTAQPGVATINYTVYFSNGESCRKTIDLDCGKPIVCCDSIEVRAIQDPADPNTCCAEISSKCDVDSISVSVTNGTLSSASWNCGAIPAGYVGQSTYTFVAGGCPADLITCVDAKQSGVVGINYVVYLSNGEKCEKSFKLDCKAKTCCEKVKLEKVVNADGTAGCCVKLTTECEVKSILVKITNGTFSSNSWNCTATIPAAAIGQSSYTFAPSNCVVEMENCISATQPGAVTVTYIINFANGEECEKVIELDCGKPVDCCENIEVRAIQDPADPNTCCAQISSKCDVDSISVSVLNGTISSANWNCGAIPAGYVGQSAYTFVAGGCPADLITCVDAKQSGVVTINYVVYMSNGEKCEKSFKLDCKAKTCCEKVKLEKVENADGTVGCCVKLTTECEVKSILVKITNGTFSSNSWNCTATIPAAAIGQSSYTFAPSNCVVEMENCISATQPGAVTVTYIINFANGEECEKVIDLDCEKPVDCCENIKIRQIVDADGTAKCCAEISSKCDVDSISVSITNGTLSSASWNCGAIPAGYVGQSAYTFVAGGCPADLITCVDAKQSGVVGINYVVYLSNGEKCEKSFKLDCKAKTCCEKVKLEKVVNADGTAGCCVKLTTECEVKSILVKITNGTFSSNSWNCTATIPAAAIGQRSYTFAPSNCVVEMENCISATQPGAVTVSYVINFANGEKCEKVIDLDCEKPVDCCENIKIRQIVDADGTAKCCAGVSSKCDVDSIAVSVTNGTLSSASWNCGAIPAGYVGQSTYTFVAGGCPADLITCVDAKQSGIVGINYVVYLSNGEKCEKSFKIDCLNTAVQQLKQVSDFEFFNLFPNPAKGSFNITYRIGKQRDIEIRLVNPLGQTVKTIQRNNEEKGEHTIKIDVSKLASGLYKVVLFSNGETLNKSAVLKE